MEGIDFGMLPELLGYRLRQAQLAVFQDFLRSTAEDQMAPGQFGVLELIESNPGLNQTRLGQALGVDRSTVVGVIDKLQSRGLVERRTAARDRRAYALALTPAGRAMLKRLRPLVRTHEARIAARLSEAERATLMALLERIAPIV